MGVKIAKDFVVDKKKPKNTKIHRIPQGCEDAMFKSYFECFMPPIVQDFGKGAGMDMSTSAQQNIAKQTEQKMRAANLMLEKLGNDYTKTVYWLEGHQNPVVIEDPDEQGKFFAESCYVLSLKSKSHHYMICWMGIK